MSENGPSQPQFPGGEAAGQVLVVPTFYVSAMSISQFANDFSVVFSTPSPVVLPDGQMAQYGALVHACKIQMSAQTLKDWTLVLSRAVERHEAIWGVIETDYTRQMATAAAQK